MTFRQKAFTLLEVLVALVIIAIALVALTKATSENVSISTRIKDKSIRHWIAMQGVKAVQLNLIQVHLNQEVTEVTKMLGRRYYWRAKLLPTEMKTVQQIIITVSSQQAGPFEDPLIAFRYVP